MESTVRSDDVDVAEEAPESTIDAAERQIALADAITASLSRIARNAEVGLDGAGFETSVSSLWRSLLTDPTPPSPPPPPHPGPTDAEVESGPHSSTTAVVAVTGLRGWYAQGADYWEGESIPADESGVLGGQQHIAPWDVEESLAFIQALQDVHGIKTHACLDCGAGIGRVTRDVLSRRFDIVDLLEQSPKMITQAKIELAAAHEAGRVGHFLCAGVQDVVRAIERTRGMAALLPRVYSCVWLQWVVGCVTDVDLVDFFRACQYLLEPGGVVIIKDNFCAPRHAFEYDADDASIVRSRAYFDEILRHGRLSIIHSQRQLKWDKELVPVDMIACVVTPSPAERFQQNLRELKSGGT